MRITREVAHTPGPWVCHSGMVYKDGPNVWPKGDDNGIPIARMDREPGNGTFPVERDANARLIAAAPELLEALEALMRSAEGLATCSPELEQGYIDQVLEDVELAHRLVGKAKGELA